MEKGPLSALLKHYRLRAHLTQEELAERARLSVRAISALERGTRRRPYQETLTLLAEALHLSAEERAQLAASVPRHRRPARAVDAPASLTPAALPWPVPLTRLIGREREAAAAFHLLQQEAVRLLTLTGPPGVGKTRLALHLAARLADRFADGVQVVWLAALHEPSLVFSALAEALEVRETGTQSPLDSLKLALRAKPRLLVLDNFEQVLPAAPLLVELLAACPQITALVTSRARLQVRGEQVLRLAPLPLPDLAAALPPAELERYGAVALFVERVRALQPDFHLTADQAPLIAEVCVRLDGLPLAIELAAARFPLLPPKELLERLGSPAAPTALQVVQGHLVDLPERQHSLRAAIDWSYALLTEAEQRLFRRLCVFVGGAALEAVLAVCAEPGEDEPQMLERLEALLTQNLVYRLPEAPLRFGVLLTLREYGLEHLATAGEALAMRSRYARYLLALAERETARLRGPEQASALARLSQETANLRAALRWWQDQDDLEHGLHFASVLWPFWLRQGALSEGRDWLETLLARGEQSGQVQPQTLARACYGAGALAAEQGEYAHALALAERCARLAEQVGEQHLHARALNLQGNVTKLLGRFAQAARHYEASLALFRALHEEAAISMLLNNLSTLVQEQGDYARARTLLEESLAIKRRQGDQRGIALVLTNLGDTARKVGHLDEARAYAEESLALLEQLGDEKILSSVFNNLGEVAVLQGAYAQAATYLQHSRTLAERVGAEWMIAAALHTRGRLEAARGERAEAERAYRQSFQLYRRERSHLGMVECLEGLIALSATTDPALGARLYGLTSAFRARMETPVPPVDVPQFAQAEAAMRAALGEEAFTAALTTGRVLDLDQVFVSLLASRPLD